MAGCILSSVTDCLKWGDELGLAASACKGPRGESWRKNQASEVRGSADRNLRRVGASDVYPYTVVRHWWGPSEDLRRSKNGSAVFMGLGSPLL